MRFTTHGIRIAPALGVLLLLAACGTSGHDQPEYAEVHIQIQPASGATDFRFVVDSIFANDANESYLAGAELTTTGPFNIFFENAQPVYGGTFKRVGASPDLNVTMSVVSASNQTSVTDSTLGAKNTATVVIGGTPPPADAIETSQIRFQVCAPLPDTDGCFSDTGSGTPGIAFNGTIGDVVSSHQVYGTTPAVYFLQKAQDTVEASLTRNANTGPSLRVELYIGGVLKSTQTGTGDLIFREDL